MQTIQPANSRISMSEFLYLASSIILCSSLFVLDEMLHYYHTGGNMCSWQWSLKLMGNGKEPILSTKRLIGFHSSVNLCHQFQDKNHTSVSWLKCSHSCFIFNHRFKSQPKTAQSMPLVKC